MWWPDIDVHHRHVLGMLVPLLQLLSELVLSVTHARLFSAVPK